MWKWRLTWKQLWLSSINIICCSFRGSMTQKPLLFSFLKVQSRYTVHKVIISIYFIWSWYSIHFVSLHHSYHHHHLPILIQQSIESFNLSPFLFTWETHKNLINFQFSSKPNKVRGGELNLTWLHWEIWIRSVKTLTFKIKEDSVQLHTETSHLNSRFPTTNVICPFINIRVLVLIFLTALRLFQSRDYTFF